jgi:hypothetical protein
LTLTAGVRLDVPYIPNRAPENPELLRQLGISTAVTPSGNALWSPRLGLNYDVSGRGTTFLRGGIGLFAARAPYFWFQQAYTSRPSARGPSSRLRSSHTSTRDFAFPGT